MYSRLPVPGKTWHPIEPENLSLPENGTKPDPHRSAFRLLYEPLGVPSARQEFIPLFPDHDREGDASEDAGVQRDSARLNASGEAEYPGFKSDSTSDRQSEPDSDPDSKAIRDLAYEEGFSEGEKAGLEAGKRNADETARRMLSLLQQTEGLWGQLVSKYEEKILELVFRVSERVICGNAVADHETAKRVILDAFRMIPEPVEVTIDIHPEDAEHIERVKEVFFEQNKGLKTISLLPDPSVGRGGCRLKTRFGEVDATLAARLEAVHQTVMNVYRNRGDNGLSG